MQTLPIYLPIIFILTTLLTVFFFYKATHGSRTSLLIISSWLLLQLLIARTGFYTITTGFPPRFVLVLLPPLLAIVALFVLPAGRKFLDSLDPRMLTLLHVVRIPVEVGLYFLFISKAVPKLMTFEGNNLDILSGISALFIYYFGFVKQKIGRKWILAWNFICLGLLVNIVVIAVLSAPFAFQKMAFDQPNIAILRFPYVWLPACIVPMVLLSHLAVIRHLLISR